MPDTRIEIGEFQAWITSENRELLLYEVQSKGNEATCWIASEEGKEFSINIKRTQKGEYLVLGSMFLDGWFAGGKLLEPDTLKARSREYIRLSAAQVKNYCFGKLNVTDADVPEPTKRKELGEIRVRFDKGTYRPHVRRSSWGWSVPEAEAVNERSKKALTHQVEYGASRTLAATDTCIFIPAAEGSFTPFTITFKYRPIAMLQAMDIAPSPGPSPNSLQQAPHPTSRESGGRKRNFSLVNADGDGDNKEAALQSIERKLMAELEVIRKRKKARCNTSIKEESTSSSFSGDVIDLT